MAEPHESTARNVRHTREGVVDAALRILDEQGLPDLTMRHLAGALDVQPSALYWHFPNKQTLLAAVSDRIVRGAGGAAAALDAGGAAEPEPAVPAAAEPIRAAAAALRAALLAHRDGAELVSSTEALGLGSGAALAGLTNAVSRAGIDPRTGTMAATALLHFVLGHVSHEQQRLQYRRLAAAAAGVGPTASGAQVPDDEAFDFGIGLLAEGLRRLAEAPATAAGAEVSSPRAAP